MLVAVVLGIGLVPRFPDWDRYGAPRTRTLAMVNMMLTVLVPLATFALALSLGQTSMYTSAWDLLPYASNIAVAALLVVVLVGIFGRLLGAVLWVGVVYLVVFWQAATPTYSRMLPFTGHTDANGLVDADTRWAWIVLLALAAISVARVRRSVPVGLSLRVAED
ncbi:hypothetical protein M3148_16775 [Georgenia satyanarayanai]|uniref:hypothetical protein n=1 Tax=Georgenia satyanarayanai TaxID=860221 RepID=UPI00203CAEA1|nr:hypothetical protein [Georgenia satyanarayanai]MCM3662628.1 hypothetical protein [Georgenia satyanarayanai]